ncbi:uracil-DNA glycosylase [Marivibrio halodurans]|uniref:Type-5 uracil-DNA glycosylase n=1 Tax=Marivibrio halodurans TaxID=2039722 RepID=A0A8J7SL11_9PROT|nr:uracil-DNA glycosylase [Marivibrio halodurans]MBP5855876.1 uracil-DNA glycosylase [Marivibrio halodurans]
MSTSSAGFENPPSDCPLCPRLVEFRAGNQAAHPDFHNAPVASFGPIDARLLVLGLAPGLKGANATGRPFTGDYAGDLLYDTLLRHGFARGTYAKHAGDGLTLVDCRIANAVRCVPPQNKPTPKEIATCRPFLVRELSAMTELTAILCLGRIAHETALRTLGHKLKDHPFAHGAGHAVMLPTGARVTLVDSYHCSRYNTNTGRLTVAMFDAVFERLKQAL